MAWTLTSSIEEYLAQAGGYLRASPVKNTIELVATETLRARGLAAYGGPPPLFGWWYSPAGDIAAALLHTPPYPALLSGDPAAAAPLAAELAARGRALPGVNGPADSVTAFAAAWQQHTGAPSTVQRRSRLFRLDDLIPPEPMPAGAARIAAEADTDLLADWYAAFAAETGQHDGVARRDVIDRLGYGGLTIWEVAAVPVAMAGRARPAAGIVRVGPVYTPPGQRRRGYGGAATVAVTRAGLDDGADGVVLFTDLANPASNALYVRLGYRPVTDRLQLAFEAASGS
jgi:RimJ/RimL family protein N-acetyltransferase